MDKVRKVINFCIKESVSVKNNIIGIKNLPGDINQATKIGVRYSKINNESIFKSAAITGQSITQRGLKQHLPAMCALIGFPAPFGSIAGFGVGKLLQRII